MSENVDSRINPDVVNDDEMALEWEAFDREFLAYRTPLETILRGHLLVQAALIRFVEAGLAYPDALDLAKVEFPLLVKLAVAVGIIESDDAPGFLKLNAFRNRFAHNIDAGISLQDAIDFYHSLSSRYRVGTGMEEHKPFPNAAKYALILRSVKSLYFGTKTDLRRFREQMDL